MLQTSASDPILNYLVLFKTKNVGHLAGSKNYSSMEEIGIIHFRCKPLILQGVYHYAVSFPAIFDNGNVFYLSRTSDFSCSFGHKMLSLAWIFFRVDFISLFCTLVQLHNQVFKYQVSSLCICS